LIPLLRTQLQRAQNGDDIRPRKHADHRSVRHHGQLIDSFTICGSALPSSAVGLIRLNFSSGSMAWGVVVDAHCWRGTS